jgi:predicted DCC family thiol-disulfide oxidoreductase YuxK
MERCPLSIWKPRPAGDLPDGLILFDGVCVLCSGWVRFILPRDRRRHFRFVAIQSAAGAELAARFGIDAADPQTVAVIEKGHAYFKGDAPLAVWRGLPGWGWTAILAAVPRPLRDFAYDRVARHRYRWFGRRETCLAPDPGLRDRFVDDPSGLAVHARRAATGGGPS